ncbi:MAG TPA: alpha/beta fold hydrolase [Ramlibacter sp.]|nr:alpha/beta fold hydrolase [Ramlibacter sp.]
MADELAGFPYCELAVNKSGLAVDAGATQKAADTFAQAGVTDLFIVSHGWNNNMDEARGLYKDFFTAVRNVLDQNAVPGLNRKFGIAGVLWPSKKFTDEELIPGGAASVTPSVRSTLLARKIDGLKGVFTVPNADAILQEAKDLLPDLESTPAAREKFGLLIRSLMANMAGDGEDASRQFVKMGGADLMQRLAVVVLPTGPAKPGGGAVSMGGAAAGAAGGPAGGAALFNPFSGVTAAAANLLNLTTFYQMKERAGMIGRTAVNDLVKAVVARLPDVKLHVVGHSFGARLVTSLALGKEGVQPQKFASMTLLQAAFSHNGFADKFTTTGFFRAVVSDHRITGPILVTCTANDKAVGLAYPLASLVAGQNASGFGGPTDPFGGLGRNGAQNTTEAVAGELLPVGSAYDFKAGTIFNLNADKVISGHSDICKPEVAYALLKSVASA